MAARSFLLASVVAAPLLTGVPTLLAQEQTPQVENAPFKFEGQVNSAAVMVRSGPGENYYATARLEKGVPVTVVGIQFDWLKVIPPQGSFSVVAKQFVDKQGDSTVGRVNTDNLNVRAGSSLTPVKVTIQCKLQKGDTVTILDQQDEYYKIQPPPSAYVYIHRKFVDPVKQIDLVDNTRPNKPDATNANDQTEQGALTRRDDNAIGNPTTRPVKEVIAGNTPTTRPVRETQARAQEVDVLAERLKAENRFDELENTIRINEGKGLEEQPFPQLLSAYQELLKNEYLPRPSRQMSELRVASLTIKVRAQNEFNESRRQLADARSRLDELRARRQQLAQQIELTVFAAVGHLQPSTVQVGEGTLYRLTDPKTNRTLCYVRSADPAFVTFVDKFVGVRGQVIVDGGLSLKVVNATEIANVDPAKVNNGVSAPLIPQSLIAAPLSNTATTNGN